MRVAASSVESVPALPSEEAEAVAALKRGDASALDVLLRLHQLRAVRTAHLIVGDRAAAEDAVADAFIAAYERIAQFDERRAFGPWFYRIVVNNALMWLRRNGRKQSLDDGSFESLADEATTPAEQAIEGEQRRRVVSAIQSLPPDQRAAVVLRYYADMNDKQIAEATGTPLATVRWRLHWARRKLRDALADDAAAQGKWE